MLHIRLTPAVYNTINNKFTASTCRKLSEYPFVYYLIKLLQ
jgi:hypothetical protein